MLHAHSLLWHYLWAAPNVLLLILGFLMWKRGLAKQIPAFFAFAILSGISELTVYAADVIPNVDPWTFWRMYWGGLLIVALLKFILIGEIFAQVFGGYASVSQTGRVLIRAIGVVLVFTASVLAAIAPPNSHIRIISGAQVFSQTTYIIESGLLVFIFFFAFYFRLSWERRLFGIALGLAISSCVHLGNFALIANGGLSEYRRLIATFVNMAVYHLCVLIWFYYLLVPKRSSRSKTRPPSPPDDRPSGPAAGSENSENLEELESWNKELERLIHQ